MIELTQGAQGRLDDYLTELRQALSGSASVDPAEVERDVRDHIAAALEGHAPPVDTTVLDGVLSTLGSPAQWLPEGEIAWFRQSPALWPAHFKQAAALVGRRLAGGPESYRLAYSSLFGFILGAWSVKRRGPIDEVLFASMIIFLVSFILARAALALFGADRLTGGQKWLLYPSLLAVYLPVAAIVLIGPVAIAGGAAMKYQHEFNRAREDLTAESHLLDKRIAEESHAWRVAQTDGMRSRSLNDIQTSLAGLVSRRETVQQELKLPPHPTLWNVSLTPVVMIYGLIAIAGATWFLVGIFCTLFPRAVRNTLHPFADDFSRRMGFGLAVLGLLMSFAGVVVIR